MSAAPKLNSQTIVAKLDELPTLPTIVYELSKVINDPMSSTREVEELMSNDQSLTTKVLRLANSAYYAIPGGVSNLQRAIAYIGYDAISQLVLSTSIINALDAKSSPHFEPSQFWKHSIGVAMASETTAKFVRHKAPSDLFTCGLVHDMGKVAMYIVAPEMFNETLALVKEKNISVVEAETTLGSPKHTLIGRELAQKWRLPPHFQAVNAHHHQKDTALRGGISQEMNLVVDIVYLSNLLVHALQFGHSGHNKIVGVPKDVLERLNLDSEKLKDLIGKIKVSIASADNFLKIIGG
jgi:HD-like signal output (HDOD) protein